MRSLTATSIGSSASRPPRRNAARALDEAVLAGVQQGLVAEWSHGDGVGYVLWLEHGQAVSGGS